MKLVTYRHGSRESVGFLVQDRIVDIPTFWMLKLGATPAPPGSMLDLLRGGDAVMERLGELRQAYIDMGLPWEQDHRLLAIEQNAVTLLAPLPHPPSVRDGYAFRQHVEAARRNRGLEMIPEFDEIPIFYFTNHQAITGPGPVSVRPLHCEQLDFELECAIVIGRQGRNIPASEADQYIAGYMVMNDWSARALQMKEMKLNLGPAKGKDFATSIGPWLVTRDELAAKRVPTDRGEKFDLIMTTHVNGTLVSRGNLKDMHWTFAELVERASYGVTLHPGDVIGSGTVGTGCFLELNGSKVYDPAWWLKPGDAVICEIEMLGRLDNTLELEP